MMHGPIYIRCTFVMIAYRAEFVLKCENFQAKIVQELKIYIL